VASVGPAIVRVVWGGIVSRWTVTDPTNTGLPITDVSNSDAPHVTFRAVVPPVFVTVHVVVRSSWVVRYATTWAGVGTVNRTVA
jgi:hypothetical protein